VTPDKPAAGPPGIDADLRMVADGIGALQDLASDPAKAQDRWRVYDFGIRWGVLMSGRLERVEHYHRLGELTEAQEARYQELRRELEGAVPLIERLDLARPRVPLEDGARAVSGQDRPLGRSDDPGEARRSAL
jgi:hypothetical protein